MTEHGPKSDPPNRRILALLLTFAAVAALGYASFSKRWLYNPRTQPELLEVGFGPLGHFECLPRDTSEDPADGQTKTAPKFCRSSSNAELVATWNEAVAAAMELSRKHPEDMTLYANAIETAKELRTSGAFSPFGWVALVSCLIAALSLAIAGALVAANKRVSLPIMPTTTAMLGLMVGIVCGCVFVALKPGPAGYVGVGLGFFSFGAGIIGGTAAALMLNKLLRPHDPDLLEDSMHPDHY